VELSIMNNILTAPDGYIYTKNGIYSK
jgi:hypothetical protein